MKNTTSRSVIDEADGHSIKDEPCSFGGLAAETRSFGAALRLRETQHLARHSWHSCDTLKDTKAKSTMSRQAAALQS